VEEQGCPNQDSCHIAHVVPRGNLPLMPASMELILTGTVGLADLSPTYIHYLLLYLIIYRYAKVAKAYIDR